MSDHEDWEDDEASWKMPVLAAILVGGAVLVGALLFVPQLVERPDLPVLIGGFAALGLILWIGGYLFSIRRAPALVQIGSAVVLIGAGALAGMAADQQYVGRSSVDASSFAEADTNLEGDPVLPKGAASRGPLSAAYLDSITAMQAERREYGRAIAALNPGALNSPYLIEETDGVLDNCGRFDAAKTLVAEAAGKESARVAELRDALDGSALSGDVRRGVEMMIDPLTDEERERRTALESEMLGKTGELCTLLAQRGWSNVAARFRFSSASGQQRFDAINQQRLDAVEELSRLRRKAIDRWHEGQEIVRQALS